MNVLFSVIVLKETEVSVKLSLLSSEFRASLYLFARLSLNCAFPLEISFCAFILSQHYPVFKPDFYGGIINRQHTLIQKKTSTGSDTEN